MLKKLWHMPAVKVHLSLCNDLDLSDYLLCVLIYFLLSVKAVIFIFISWRGSAISSANQGKSGSIYNLVKIGPRKCAWIS